ncbi:MAG: flagellar filament capping protein FliD [Oscillospiraceae bacterium]|nr:flagellar filament capping protein FliD [Oscillospiraceae bacterium]
MSSISNNTNRMAGLISGLETEDLVKAMTANTKNRINSKQQKLQTLQWKQEGYRSIISKINDFKNKYLKIDSASSLKANAVLKKCIATSSNDRITATASAGATPAKYTIREASAAKTASVTSGSAAASGSIKLDFSDAKSGKNYEVKVKLDGAEKTIVFTGGANAEETKQNFLDAANNAISDITRPGQKFEVNDDSRLVFNGAGDNIYHVFEITSGGKNMKEGLGLDSDKISRISNSAKLGEIGFNNKLVSENGKYNININGVSFEFTEDTTVSEMVNKINSSGAGVRMSFSTVGQSFTLETKDTGAGQELNMYQTGGNLLNSLFNISGDKLGTSSADSAKIEYAINGSYTQKIDDSKFKTGVDDPATERFDFTLNIDGVDRSFSLNLGLSKIADGDDNYSGAEINAAIQEAWLQEKAMADVSGNPLGDIELSYSADNGLTISSSDHKIVIGANNVALEVGKTNERMVTGDEMYVIAPGVDSMKFKVGDDEIEVTASKNAGISIKDLADKGLFNIRSDGTLVATSDITAVDDNAKAMLNKYFGKETLSPAKENDVFTAYGSNSTIEVSTDGENFTTYTSATNLFTFDGTTINLTDVKDFKAETEDDYITVETKKDTSGIKDVLKSFVEDYNKLIEDLYKEINTSRPKKSGAYFDPLTDEQKDEMDEDEIKKWEDQAKQGLLYRDSNITKFLSEIRGVMSRGIDGFTLRDMGIKLTDNWRDNGKLEIDEAKMDSAIEAYGDKIADFFTGPNGLAAKLENTIDKAISTKTKNYGYLTSLAGMENTKTDTDNQIYKQMKSIQDIIDKLNKKYESEQERYWKQFTTLEKYMAQMQQQASYFMQE